MYMFIELRKKTRCNIVYFIDKEYLLSHKIIEMTSLILTVKFKGKIIIHLLIYFPILLH